MQAFVERGRDSVFHGTGYGACGEAGASPFTEPGRSSAQLPGMVPQLVDSRTCRNTG